MPVLPVDTLTFTFAEEWTVSKYDEWVFYISRFQSACNGGVKAMDVVALDPARTAWLIEVKDYRRHPRTKVADLADEAATKAFDTLAGLLPAQIRSNEPGEQQMARSLNRARNLRVVLHVEQPRKHSALFPRVISLPDVQIKLRSLLHSIDPHAIVCESANLNKVPWNVA